MEKMVELIDVSYTIKDGEKTRKILDNINCRIYKNQITLVSGVSGSGKTTLLYSMSGLLSDGLTGSINYPDFDMAAASEKKRDKYRLENLSLIFQNLKLFDCMNVEDNIFIPVYAKNQRVTKKMTEQVCEYLDLMQLGQIQKKSLRSLSGGEQQRIAMIRSLIADPKLILCDEPTASLDEGNADIFLKCLKKIADLQEMTIVIVSHDPVVALYADETIWMKNGKVSERNEDKSGSRSPCCGK
jgi:putative ABC transport system ATP-binding protein